MDRSTGDLTVLEPQRTVRPLPGLVCCPHSVALVSSRLLSSSVLPPSSTQSAGAQLLDTPAPALGIVDTVDSVDSTLDSVDILRRYLATHPAPDPRAARRWRDVSAPTVRERTSKFAGKRSVVREQLRAWRLFRSVKRPVISDIRMLHARNSHTGSVLMSPPLCLLTVWVRVVGDPDPEALARGGDVEAHQRRVLARDEPSLPLRGRARAHRPRPGKVKIRAANNPSVFTITEKAPAKTKMIVKTDGSFAALIKLVIMLMVLPLLQRVRVVGQAREHITIQLPAVKHLQHSVKTTSPLHPARY